MSGLVWFGALLFAQGVALGPQSAEPVVLRPEFPTDQVLVYRLREAQTIADQAEGVEPIQTKTAIDYRMRALRSDAEGARLSIGIDRVEWSLHGPEGAIVFDTKDRRRRGEAETLSRFRSMIDKRVEVVVDSAGAVSELIPVGFSASEVGVREAAEGHVRRFLTMWAGWMPSEAVRVGHSWQREETLPLGVVDLVRKSRLSVDSLELGHARIEGVISLTGKGTQGKVEAEERLIGSIVPQRPGTCVIAFDCREGRLDRMESHVAFDMRIHRLPKNPSNPPTVSSQRLSASTTLELVRVEAAPLAN